MASGDPTYRIYDWGTNKVIWQPFILERNAKDLAESWTGLVAQREGVARYQIITSDPDDDGSLSVGWVLATELGKADAEIHYIYSIRPEVKIPEPVSVWL